MKGLTNDGNVLSDGADDAEGDDDGEEADVDAEAGEEGRHAEEDRADRDEDLGVVGAEEAGEREDDPLGDAPGGLDDEEVGVGQVGRRGRVARLHVARHVGHHVWEAETGGGDCSQTRKIT